MTTHPPTCETLRGGDHGPCDCGYDAAMAERRRKIYTAEELIDLVCAYRYAIPVEDVARAAAAVRLAVEATVRQRDALREAVEQELLARDHTTDCGCCDRLRAALEVR